MNELQRGRERNGLQRGPIGMNDGLQRGRERNELQSIINCRVK